MFGESGLRSYYPQPSSGPVAAGLGLVVISLDCSSNVCSLLGSELAFRNHELNFLMQQRGNACSCPTDAMTARDSMMVHL